MVKSYSVDFSYTPLKLNFEILNIIPPHVRGNSRCISKCFGASSSTNSRYLPLLVFSLQIIIKMYLIYIVQIIRILLMFIIYLFSWTQDVMYH